MSAEARSYQNEFLDLLNNKDKKRPRGFIVFVYGAVDLAPLQELCLSPDQSDNNCLTARYGAGPGDILAPLVSTILRDISLFQGEDPFSKMEQQVQFSKTAQMPNAYFNPSQTAASSAQAFTQAQITGIFLPTPPGGNWEAVFQTLTELGRKGETRPESFFSLIDSVLKVGERLVLFCELSGIPQDATLDEIGLLGNRLLLLHSYLPERMGLVFSGLPRGLSLPSFGERFLGLEVGPDYGSPGTAPERSQPLHNDIPTGDDQLQITSEVHALTDAVAGRDMFPPLVIGVLGGWGSGKSFVLHLLRERLRYIRNLDIRQEADRSAYPYVGHPYLIHFDAWTYAETELWASLMQRILFDLDQQLTLERNLASAGVDIRQGVDIWEIIENFSDEQLHSLGEQLGQEAVQRILDWKQGKATAETLWSTLKKVHQEEIEKLEAARKELESKERKYEKELKEKQLTAEQTLRKKQSEFDQSLGRTSQDYQKLIAGKEAELKTTHQRILVSVDQTILMTARREAWIPVYQELKHMFGQAIDTALQRSGNEGEQAPVTIWSVVREVRFTTKLVKGFSPASLAFLALVPLSIVVTYLLTQTQAPEYIASLAGTTGVLGGLLASGYSALSKTNHWLEQRQTVYKEQIALVSSDKDALRQQLLSEKQQAQILPLEDQIKDLQSQLAQETQAIQAQKSQALAQLQQEEENKIEDFKAEKEKEIRDLKEKVKEHERRAGIPGQSKSLLDLIQKRIESGFYDERLGIIHQVKKDLQEITEALLPISGPDPELFPRGEPRIIILIDDLDRCPPQQVVNVLEAAQLLVKTKLFVVVIAMDIRYITRALEKKYEGILVHEGNPSGLDYIEKIVQIPYRVRPIAPEAMDGYLRSQIQIKQAAASQPEPAPVESRSGGLPPAEITAPGQENARINAALPPEIQQFDLQELELLKTCALEVEISPRSTKRLVNAMKLIKIIWYRRGEQEPAANIKQATVLLMTLSAGFPEVMARLLDELERHLCHTETQDCSRPLKNILEAGIQQWSGCEGVQGDWAAVKGLIQNERLLDAGLTLEEIGLRNIQIVRAFSFLGEVNTPLVEKSQNLEVTLRHPNGKPVGGFSEMGLNLPEVK